MKTTEELLLLLSLFGTLAKAKKRKDLTPKPK